MRTVLLAAACTLCLAFTAHGAERVTPADATSQLPATPLAVAPQGQDGCMPFHAFVAKTAYAEDADSTAEPTACCTASPNCAQFLSTQALLKPPSRART